MKLPLGDLNPGLCPPHLISIYICGVTTAPRVCGGTSPRDGNEAGQGGDGARKIHVGWGQRSHPSAPPRPASLPSLGLVPPHTLGAVVTPQI